MYLLETRYCNCNIIVLMPLIRVETIVGRTRLFIFFSGKGSARVFLLDSVWETGSAYRRTLFCNGYYKRFSVQRFYEYNVK